MSNRINGKKLVVTTALGLLMAVGIWSTFNEVAQAAEALDPMNGAQDFENRLQGMEGVARAVNLELIDTENPPAVERLRVLQRDNGALIDKAAQLGSEVRNDGTINNKVRRGYQNRVGDLQAELTNNSMRVADMINELRARTQDRIEALDNEVTRLTEAVTNYERTGTNDVELLELERRLDEFGRDRDSLEQELARSGELDEYRRKQVGKQSDEAEIVRVRIAELKETLAHSSDAYSGGSYSPYSYGPYGSSSSPYYSGGSPYGGSGYSPYSYDPYGSSSSSYYSGNSPYGGGSSPYGYDPYGSSSSSYYSGSSPYGGGSYSPYGYDPYGSSSSSYYSGSSPYGGGSSTD
jgi:hypothetical protein